ncbi:F0F1 ATP synthase subunit A [Pacificimonas flava]|uniref:ATP synthase subunit a n=2 Tax=Pacificimonas TaxID=1960290 RepID=A0A219B7U7_9SPHN|nr:MULTISPECIES: F0F1 ATP synthase subunit A [Pacificimonas]MBZ6378473.1 F0F1 ATP synthase subunit A [Pacificimonas aurantium]OWV34233.1 F0F1 ATP synthase subunit A [Pacificimonas flava]
MASPLEQFEIKPVYPIEVSGYDLSFTNASAFMIGALVLIWLFMFLGMRKAELVPGRWQSAVESIYDFVHGMVDQNIGPKGKKYVPFIFTLFMFILVANVAGLLPYSFTVTSHLAVTFAFAALIFVMCIIIGIARHGIHWFSYFLPPGTPLWLVPLMIFIEIVSFLSRPITLSVRLFANMTAGHILLKVFAGFVISLGLAGGIWSVVAVLPLIMNVALYALELLVAVVQAYVFALLATIYLNDSINLEH